MDELHLNKRLDEKYWSLRRANWCLGDRNEEIGKENERSKEKLEVIWNELIMRSGRLK